MVKSSEYRQGNNLSIFWRFYFPRYGTLLVDSQMSATSVVVVIDILVENSVKMGFVQNNALVHTIVTKIPHSTLCDRILPWTFMGGYHFFDAHRFYAPPEFCTKDGISAAKKISGGGSIRKCIHNLLRCPLSRRRIRNVEVQDLATVM